MRKLMSLLLAAIIVAGGVMALSDSGAVHAQGGGTTLPLNEWVEGSVSPTEFEIPYTFSATAGELILIEMYDNAADYSVDPKLILSDSSGTQLAEDDDTVGLGAVIVFEVPADGEYSLLATTAFGADGTDEGTYIIRASQVTPLEVGSTIETTIYAEDSENVPVVSVIRPEADVTLAFSFTQEPSDLYVSLSLEAEPVDEFDFGNTVFELSETSGLSGATLNAPLTAGETYLFVVQKAPFSFSFDTTESTVSVTVSEAQ
jgi:hypothetical protein